MFVSQTKCIVLLFCSHFIIIQWTGVLIGAAVAVSIISIVTFFLHRIFKAGECVIIYGLECFHH